MINYNKVFVFVFFYEPNELNQFIIEIVFELMFDENLSCFLHIHLIIRI